LTCYAQGWTNMSGGTNDYVSALTNYGTYSQGYKLVVGGHFTSAGGNSANYIAMWYGDNIFPVWENLGSGFNGEVYALTEQNSMLYAGGYFTMAGGVSTGRIAMWDGNTWTPLGLGVNASVSCLKTFQNNLVAGG